MAARVLIHPDSGYFFQQLTRAQRGMLVLEYDSTLARLRAIHRQRFPCPSVREILASLVATTDTRLVLLCGKRKRGLPQRLGLWPDPEVWELDPAEGGAVQHNGAHLDSSAAYNAAPRGETLAEICSRLCATVPVVYLSGSGAEKNLLSRWFRSTHITIRPQFYLAEAEGWVGAPEDLLQFLIDWVRACGGEPC